VYVIYNVWYYIVLYDSVVYV